MKNIYNVKIVSSTGSTVKKVVKASSLAAVEAKYGCSLISAKLQEFSKKQQANKKEPKQQWEVLFKLLYEFKDLLDLEATDIFADALYEAKHFKKVISDKDKIFIEDGLKEAIKLFKEAYSSKKAGDKILAKLALKAEKIAEWKK